MNAEDWPYLVVCALGLIISFQVYGSFLTKIQDQGGGVRANYLGLPETLVAVVLLTFLCADLLAPSEKKAPDLPLNKMKIDVLLNAVAVAVVPLALLFFMAYRKVPLLRLYGLEKIKPLSVVGRACGYLLASLPFVLAVNILTQFALKKLGEDAIEQTLVEIYRQAVSSGNFELLWKIALSAVIIAPVSEELLFRGFFYPALKRHLGGVWSALITSVVFGLVHHNAASFLSLVVLGFALIIAYERTGSLLVSVCMHAMFNALSLFLMWHMVKEEPMKVSQIGEDALVTRLTRNLPTAPDVRVGPGSDCAVIGVSGDREWLVLKTDCVVEGVHFTESEKPERVGWKALCRAVSDVAASGGVPRHALITVAASRNDSVERLTRIYSGIRKAAKRFEIAVVGGETSRSPGPLFLNVALTGRVEPKRCVSRTGGRAGDLLYVTGRLGGSRAGKHLDFIPRLEEARWLTGNFLPRAMMDLSDGLGTDLPRLAAASGCGFELLEERVPCSKGCSVKAALTDGEDFELLFAAAPRTAARMEIAWKKKFPRLPLTCVGSLVTLSKTSTSIQNHGFDHFA